MWLLKSDEKPFSARVCEWRDAEKVVFMSPFSSKVHEGVPGGWPQIIDEGALDIVALWKGGRFRVVKVSEKVPTLFHRKYASEGKPEELTALLTDPEQKVVMFDAERFGVPLMENALGIKVEAEVIDLLRMVKEADAALHEDAGRRIPLHKIANVNRKSASVPLFQYLPMWNLERARNWTIGGTRTVVSSLTTDLALMVQALHGMHMRGGIMVPSRERSGAIFKAFSDNAQESCP